MRYHYTYRITNIELNKHYYGCRSSKCSPPEDLGIKYFSSSTDKDFIKDQKENPYKYKYKIIKIYETKKEAIGLEIKLHNKLDVGINESFYNKAKQTSSGFVGHFSESDRERISKEKKELYKNHPEIIEKQKRSKARRYESDPTYRLNLSNAQKKLNKERPELLENVQKKAKMYWENLSVDEYTKICAQRSERAKKYAEENLTGKTYDEIFGEEKSKEIRKKLSRPKSEEHKIKISEARAGRKATEEARKNISLGVKKRYEDEYFYDKFCETMSVVNKRKDKREKAGQKIKQKWKDPEYLEKMKKRKGNVKYYMAIIQDEKKYFETLSSICDYLDLSPYVVRKIIKENTYIFNISKQEYEDKEN